MTSTSVHKMVLVPVEKYKALQTTGPVENKTITQDTSTQTESDNVNSMTANNAESNRVKDFYAVIPRKRRKVPKVSQSKWIKF